MPDTTKNNVPDGFILLQTQNGAPKYAACMTGRLAGWLMKKYPDGNWVSERKLTNLEVMQAEDQRDDGIVHETPAATIKKPVMVAEPVGCAEYDDEGTVCNGELDVAPCPKCQDVEDVAPMVADPAGVAVETWRERAAKHKTSIFRLPPPDEDFMRAEIDDLRKALAATVKAVPSEAPAGKSLNAQAADLLRPHLKKGQKVIWREPFRWHDDNGVMSNHYDGASLESLADDFGYMIEWDFNLTHAAIIGNFAAPLADKTGGGE